MIRIQNVYHMLAYAFSVLSERGYRNVATEKFDNAAELFAAILERGIANQVKRGLGREYTGRTEALSSLRGKVKISDSVKSRELLRHRLVCSYDEFTVDSRMNRIIKATVAALIRSNISKTRKKSLKKLMVYFVDVEQVDLRLVDWNLHYNRNNRTYRMLMAVCWLVAKGLLQTQADGTTHMMDFLDEQRMCRLYERFLLEYYRKEHPELAVGASHIDWVLDDGFDDYLPSMKSDVMLSRDDRVLIIDAKYYAYTMQHQFDKRSIHSNNLYQIFAYVKNKEACLAHTGAPHEVSGLLLYARTDEETQPDGVYRMSGNQISVKTLDLNQPFSTIRAQLDRIAREYFFSE